MSGESVMKRTFVKRIMESGFSLIEVNMAIFVMAMGILSMVVLYPLGLRESYQGTADLKQSAYADFLLNQVVAIGTMTNFPWSEWIQIPEAKEGATDLDMNELPNFIRSRMVSADGGSFQEKDSKFMLGCCRIMGRSDRLMAVMVQCTESDKLKGYQSYSNNPIYYAEVLFQGDPSK